MAGRVEGNVECTYMKANRNAMMEWISRESDSGGAVPVTENVMKRNRAAGGRNSKERRSRSHSNPFSTVSAPESSSPLCFCTSNERGASRLPSRRRRCANTATKATAAAARLHRVRGVPRHLARRRARDGAVRARGRAPVPGLRPRLCDARVRSGKH